LRFLTWKKAVEFFESDEVPYTLTLIIFYTKSVFFVNKQHCDTAEFYGPYLMDIKDGNFYNESSKDPFLHKYRLFFFKQLR